MINLQAVRATAEQIALQAGAVLMRYYGQPHEESTKSSIFDVVTEGDKASEAVIVPALRAAFPDHRIVSEEGDNSGIDHAPYRWYVDPIDGTANFSKNLPYFSVSIALADRTMTPLVGVVLNPVTAELFSAARGYGATLNGKTMHVSNTAHLENALLITGFSPQVELAMNNMRHWINFITRARATRRFGSAALDLCYVAAGRADGFWESDIFAWDCLAGLLCVVEAGGRISDYSGSMEKVYSGSEIIASNGKLHDEIQSVLNLDNEQSIVISGQSSATNKS